MRGGSVTRLLNLVRQAHRHHVAVKPRTSWRDTPAVARQAPGRYGYSVSVTKRVFVGFIAGLAVAWVAASAGLYAAMRQTPEVFGAIMARLPTAAMIVLPFKPLWMSARSGALRAGDTAPDFTLPVLHGGASVTLSKEWAQRPVVLVFGSYT